MIQQIMTRLTEEAAEELKFRDNDEIVSYNDHPEKWQEFVERILGFRLDQELENEWLEIIYGNCLLNDINEEMSNRPIDRSWNVFTFKNELPF